MPINLDALVKQTTQQSTGSTVDQTGKTTIKPAVNTEPVVIEIGNGTVALKADSITNTITIFETAEIDSIVDNIVDGQAGNDLALATVLATLNFIKTYVAGQISGALETKVFSSKAGYDTFLNTIQDGNYLISVSDITPFNYTINGTAYSNLTYMMLVIEKQSGSGANVQKAFVSSDFSIDSATVINLINSDPNWHLITTSDKNKLANVPSNTTSELAGKVSTSDSLYLSIPQNLPSILNSKLEATSQIIVDALSKLNNDVVLKTDSKYNNLPANTQSEINTINSNKADKTSPQFTNLVNVDGYVNIETSLQNALTIKKKTSNDVNCIAFRNSSNSYTSAFYSNNSSLHIKTNSSGSSTISSMPSRVVFDDTQSIFNTIAKFNSGVQITGSSSVSGTLSATVFSGKVQCTFSNYAYIQGMCLDTSSDFNYALYYGTTGVINFGSTTTAIPRDWSGRATVYRVLYNINRGWLWENSSGQLVADLNAYTKILNVEGGITVAGVSVLTQNNVTSSTGGSTSDVPTWGLVQTYVTSNSGVREPIQYNDPPTSSTSTQSYIAQNWRNNQVIFFAAGSFTVTMPSMTTSSSPSSTQIKVPCYIDIDNFNSGSAITLNIPSGNFRVYVDDVGTTAGDQTRIIIQPSTSYRLYCGVRTNGETWWLVKVRN